MKKEAFEAARSSAMSGAANAGAKGEAHPHKTDPIRRGHLRGQGGLEGPEGDAPPDLATTGAADGEPRRGNLRGQGGAGDVPLEVGPTDTPEHQGPRRGALRGQGGHDTTAGEAHPETAAAAPERSERRPKLRGQDNTAETGTAPSSDGSSRKSRDA